MPRFDFKCPACGTLMSNVYRGTSDTQRPQVCINCDALMEKLPSAPNFTVTGFNAKNGYSK
jgi:putative FmdB family regulatory protein